MGDPVKSRLGARRVWGFGLLLVLLTGCGGSSGSHGTGTGAAPTYAVLSAFPAELAAVLQHVDVEETTTIDGHIVRVGRLGKAHVVVAMTGIGLLNAAATTNVILDNVAVDGVVVSGVAGSPHRIADVVVPQSWAASDGVAYAVDPHWLALATRFAARGAAQLAQCTSVPNHSDGPVCLAFEPAIFVGGRGSSSDTFGSVPFKCSPSGGEVFGCDVAQPTALSQRRSEASAGRRQASDDEPVSSDMETAAIGRAAQEHGIPYIAFRAVSDGAEDPLGLPGFPTQFFAYYPLAAHNAAAAAAGFIGRLPH